MRGVGAALALVASVGLAAAEPRYRAVRIERRETWTGLAQELGPERTLLVLKVNRIDRAHVRLGATLVVPEALDDPLALSPFPGAVVEIAEVPKLLVVARRVQAFAGYEQGRLVRWGPISTGKKATPTPTGLFHTNWRVGEKVSTEDPEWLLRWYFNIHNTRGVSFHQFEMPGYPASHSCLRLHEDDARWLFGWGVPWILSPDGRTIEAHGTPVVIFGDYVYGGEAPWKRLAADPEATAVPPAELTPALAQHLPVILARQKGREELLAARANGTRPAP